MSRGGVYVAAHTTRHFSTVATERRLARAASTVETALKIAGSGWAAELLAATQATEVTVSVEFDSWAATSRQTRRGPLGRSGAAWEFTVCRESLPLTHLDAESTTCWIAQLVIEVLREVAAQYKLRPPPPLSAWTSKNIFPLRQVYTVGSTGAPDKPWHRNADLDAWLRRSRLVCDTVTDQLQHHQLRPGASPELAIRVKSGPAAACAIADVGAWASVTAPKGFAQLSARQQQDSVIGAVSEVVQRRAQRDSFDATPVLDASLTVLRSEDGTYRRSGPWVSDPTGQYQARWRFEEHWSGLGYEQLELTDQTGALITSTRWVPAGPTPWAVQANHVYWSNQEPLALIQYPHFKGRVDLLELRPTDPPALDDLPNQTA